MGEILRTHQEIKTRHEISDLEYAMQYRNDHGGRVAVTEGKTPRYYWYSCNYTMSEILADMPGIAVSII